MIKNNDSRIIVALMRVEIALGSNLFAEFDEVQNAITLDEAINVLSRLEQPSSRSRNAADRHALIQSALLRLNKRHGDIVLPIVKQQSRHYPENEAG